MVAGCGLVIRLPQGAGPWPVASTAAPLPPTAAGRRRFVRVDHVLRSSRLHVHEAKMPPGTGVRGKPAPGDTRSKTDISGHLPRVASDTPPDRGVILMRGDRRPDVRGQVARPESATGRVGLYGDRPDGRQSEHSQSEVVVVGQHLPDPAGGRPLISFQESDGPCPTSTQVQLAVASSTPTWAYLLDAILAPTGPAGAGRPRFGRSALPLVGGSLACGQRSSGQASARGSSSAKAFNQARGRLQR